MKPVFPLPLCFGLTLGYLLSPAFETPLSAQTLATDLTVVTEKTVTTVARQAPILISEVRSGGPLGARDAFVELFNTGSRPLAIGGWSLRFAAFEGGVSGLKLAPGTRIEARGHLLLVAGDYSLKNVATGDASFAASLRGGVALRDDKGQIIDAVGPSDGAPELREGAGLPVFAFAPRATKNTEAGATGGGIPAPIPQFSCVRRAVDGRPQDSGDNARDFAIVSVAGSLNGQKVQIGAPGPENASSPRRRALVVSKPGEAMESTPNATAQNVALQSDTERNSMRRARRNVGPLRTFGTMTLRYRFTNDSPETIKTLSFRVNSVGNDTGANLDSSPAPNADVRFVYGKDAISATDATDLTAPAAPLSAQAGIGSNVGIGADAAQLGSPRPFYVWKAKLAPAPAQPLGGGLNALLQLDLPTGGIAPGARGEFSFDLGVERRGNYRIVLGNARMNLVFEGNTEDDIVPATLSPAGANGRGGSAVSVSRIVVAGQNGAANGGAGTGTSPDGAPEEVAEAEGLLLEGNTEDGVLLPPPPPSGGDS